MELIWTDRVRADVGIIVETSLKGRTNAEMASELELKRLSKDMCGRMPEYLNSRRIVPVEELKRAVSLKRASEIPDGAMIAAAGFFFLVNVDEILYGKNKARRI